MAAPPEISAKTPPEPRRERGAGRILFDAALDLVYPPLCRICGEPVGREITDAVCPVCWSGVRLVVEPLCERCGLPLNAEEGSICEACRRTAPHFAKARAGGIYEGALRETIHLLKFRYRENLAPRLGRLLIEAFERWYADETFDLIVPVPLHWSRRFWREFNQAELTARALGEARGLPISTGNLIRRRRTRPQSGLSAGRKAGNVRNAFRVRHPEDFRDKRLLLIDDVHTSGYTVGECSRVLIEAGGASRVCVLTVSRAIHPADT